MKLHKLLIVLFAFSLIFGFTYSANAQEEEPWENYTEEQYLQEKSGYEQQISNLNDEIKALDNEIKALDATLKDKNEKIKKAEDELKTYGDPAAYRKDFEEAEKIINTQKEKSGKTPEEAEKMLAALEKSPFRCTGDYASRIAKMKKELEAWKTPKVATNEYTVVKGDCLWKISDKFYKEPKAWFAIWEKNKEGVKAAPPKVPKTIKNPNLIYPGQVLVIPALTDAEKKAAVEKTKKYKNKWPKKRKVVKKEATEEKKDVKKEEKKETKKEEKKDVKKDEKKKEEKKDVKKDEKKKDEKKN